MNRTLFLLGCSLLIWAINSVETKKTIELLFELGFGFFVFLFILWPYNLVAYLNYGKMISYLKQPLIFRITNYG
jgi:hypothetical protein